MYAIVEIAGKQYKVDEGNYVYVNKLPYEVGQEVRFDKVLLVADAQDVHVGCPVVEGAYVRGSVLNHVKDDKVIVFKKKRRKGYKKTQGHRQDYTQIVIQQIARSSVK